MIYNIYTFTDEEPDEPVKLDRVDESGSSVEADTQCLESVSLSDQPVAPTLPVSIEPTASDNTTEQSANSSPNLAQSSSILSAMQLPTTSEDSGQTILQIDNTVVSSCHPESSAAVTLSKEEICEGDEKEEEKDKEIINSTLEPDSTAKTVIENVMGESCENANSVDNADDCNVGKENELEDGVDGNSKTGIDELVIIESNDEDLSFDPYDSG
jgi:hypothetical protein